MLKDFILAPRLLYSIFFVGLAISVTGFINPSLWVTLFVLIFVFSFVVQYFVLHIVLKRVVTPQWRVSVLLVWMSLATLLGVWGLNELSTFDPMQSNDVNEMLTALAEKLGIYSTACQMFIAGACALRAFQMHSAL